jgi:alpha-beta hydrolase superfamily lysophospholipase
MQQHDARVLSLDAAPAKRKPPAMQPFYFQAQGRSLFAVFHPSVDARALVLMCPPLLHEHVRSYRFFSQLADRFAVDGVACLRFDYYGTGDSGGEDAEFDPAQATDDIARAADELRARGGDLPLVLMGIRGSALLACAAADAAQAEAVWLWQPEYDGARHVRELETLDLAARSDPKRYPSRILPRAGGADELMGFRVSPALRPGLSTRNLQAMEARVPVTVIAGPEDPEPACAHASLLRLPKAASDWAGEIDLRSVIHVRDAEAAVTALLRSLPRDMARVAHG